MHTEGLIERLSRVVDLLRQGTLSSLERQWAEKVLIEAFDALQVASAPSQPLDEGPSAERTASVIPEKEEKQEEKVASSEGLPDEEGLYHGPASAPPEETPAKSSHLVERVPPPGPPEEPSLFDATAAEEKETLADRLRKKQFKSLGKAIPLHHKMMFVQRLFGADERAYRKAIQFLDSCRMFAEARTYLEHEVAPQYGWDSEEEAYQVLLSYLQSRFQ